MISSSLPSALRESPITEHRTGAGRSNRGVPQANVADQRYSFSISRSHQTRKGRTGARIALGFMAVVISGVFAFPLSSAQGSTIMFDGPALCSSGSPPDGYQGYCATYNGDNTWFGSYGLGFPTDPGWGLCAEQPASGSGYPSPSYEYVSSSAPIGTDATEFAALGFALSQAQAQGFFDGQLGVFTSDQAGAAAKIFYDMAAWGDAVPSMDPGLSRAYAQLTGYYAAAQGASAAPVLSVTLSTPHSGNPTLIDAQATLVFANTGQPVPNVAVEFVASNATFANHTSMLTATTDTAGNIAVPLNADGSGTVGLSASVTTGQVGLAFFKPTVLVPSAQIIVAGFSPANQEHTASVEIPTVLYVEKTNATEPGQGIPGATYNLYVQGTPPASTPAMPPGTKAYPGVTWYATGETNATGHLGFVIPAGYSWCVAEVSAPSEFILDTGLHCTAVITTASPDPVRTVALSEEVSIITLTAYKYNATTPHTVLPGATYALFVVGAFPTGFTPPPVPSSIVVPSGMELFATGVTNAQGQLIFELPQGHAWCLQELVVPKGYLLDSGLHCTAVLTSSSSLSATTIALPELAATGVSLPFAQIAGLFILGSGLVLGSSHRRRSRKTR